MIGLVAALPAEARCFAERHEGSGASPAGAGRARLSGIGAANARRAALELVDGGATALLSWGCAGGLDPSLAAGALVLPTRIRASDGTLYEADGEWQRRLIGQLAGVMQAHIGDLIDSSAPVAGSDAKQRLFRATGAAVVDMESAAIAQVAAERRLPFLVIRAVLDSADHPLPRTALVALDAAGGLRAGAVLRSLLGRPSDLPELLRLWSALRVAQATLARVAHAGGLHFSIGATSVP